MVKVGQGQCSGRHGDGRSPASPSNALQRVKQRGGLLQRRLAEQGHSFQALLGQTRRQLAEAYLRDAVESALNQTYENLEVVIVNDGSTDGSISVYESKLLMFGTDNVDLMPDRLSKPDVPEVVLPVAKWATPPSFMVA